MELRDLEAFRQLAGDLHFGRAARAAHMSPSALSRCIQRLEQRLGRALFERDKRSVSLTAEGARLNDFLGGWLEQWSEFEVGLHGDSLLAGELRLYGSVTASHAVLAPLLVEFRNTYPGIELKLHTGDEAQGLARLQAGEDDVAIAVSPEPLPPQVEFIALLRSPLLFIAPRLDGVVRRCARQPAPDWARMPMILAEQGLSRRRAEAWFQAAGVQPNLYAQVAGHEAIVSMVSLGFGVGVVPELVLSNSSFRDSVELVAAAPALEPYVIGLCALKRRLRNPRVAAFWAAAAGGKKLLP